MILTITTSFLGVIFGSLSIIEGYITILQIFISAAFRAFNVCEAIRSLLFDILSLNNAHGASSLMQPIQRSSIVRFFLNE